MFSQHHRFLIHNQHQHPYKHNLAEFTFVNPALPGVTNVESALNWLLAVLYPNTKDAVDTKVDLLALVGNDPLDYRVVLADESSAGEPTAYRWEKREGDPSFQWYKIYSMDWGEESILSNFLLKTQDVYAYKYGVDDLNETGGKLGFLDPGTDILPGDLSGQRLYGGATAGTHLILYANSGDVAGDNTGFVQFGDDARPLVDSVHTLGTDTYRWLNFFTDEANVSTMQILGGSITDSSGAIDFDDENLSTDGTFSSGTLLLAGGSITDASGTIDFDDENLTTTGDITANAVTALGGVSSFLSGTTVGTLTLADGSITDSGGAISFGDEDLSTTGSGTFGLLTVDNIQVDSNTISTTAGDLSVAPFGGNLLLTGNLDLSGNLTLGPLNNVFVDSTGLTSTGAFQFDTTAGGFSFTPFNEEIDYAANLDPTVDDNYDLGESGVRWQDLYLSGNISDGVASILISTLLAFRSSVSGASDGDVLFWDNATQRYLPSAPDTEIDHGTISGLLGDDHTQYALLAGRSGGQTLIGGVDPSDNLVLDSTANATKGQVRFASTLSPTSDLGSDLGTSSLRFDDLYMGGEGIGFRAENATVGTLPAAAAANAGRLAWTTDVDALYVDTGGVWKKIVSDKYFFQDTTNWDGTNTSQAYNVSSQFDDAREAVWDFLDNTNGFRSVDGAVITKTATTVTVTFTIPPDSGTYSLVGVG